MAICEHPKRAISHIHPIFGPRYVYSFRVHSLNCTEMEREQEQGLSLLLISSATGTLCRLGRSPPPLCRRALDTEGVHAGGGAQLHTLTTLPSRPLSSVVCFSGVPSAELVESSRNRKRASIRCRRHSDDARSGCSFQSFCTSDGQRRFLADKNR